MSDYPDYTDLVHIIGCDVTFNIEITGATVMMPVDIQAQYITLSIDIVAQTIGNIAIDIAAQTMGNIDINLAASDITLNINIESSSITLNVDITAQTIGNLTIDISAQTVGVYLQPDWQVLQGADKNLSGSAAIAAGSFLTVLDYTNTSGLTFYICQWGFCVQKDVGVIAYISFKHNSITTDLCCSGGRTGNSQSFSKPVAVITGDHIIVKMCHFSTSQELCFSSVGGYEK